MVKKIVTNLSKTSNAELLAVTDAILSVSYTHLDVYKRQTLGDAHRQDCWVGNAGIG